MSSFNCSFHNQALQVKRIVNAYRICNVSTNKALICYCINTTPYSKEGKEEGGDFFFFFPQLTGIPAFAFLGEEVQFACRICLDIKLDFGFCADGSAMNL